jgi:hypothetical protein
MGVMKIDSFVKPNNEALMKAIKNKWHTDRLRDDADYREAWESLSDIAPEPDHSSKIIRSVYRDGQMFYQQDEMTDEEMFKYGLRKVSTVQEIIANMPKMGITPKGNLVPVQEPFVTGVNTKGERVAVINGEHYPIGYIDDEPINIVGKIYG